MQNIPRYCVRRASGPIAIDGKLEEQDSLHAERIVLKKVLQERGDNSPLRARTWIATLWDEDNLYLAFEVEDQEIWATLRDHDERLFEEECVEFFVDPDSDGRRYIAEWPASLPVDSRATQAWRHTSALAGYTPVWGFATATSGVQHGRMG